MLRSEWLISIRLICNLDYFPFPFLLRRIINSLTVTSPKRVHEGRYRRDEQKKTKEEITGEDTERSGKQLWNDNVNGVPLVSKRESRSQRVVWTSGSCVTGYERRDGRKVESGVPVSRIRVFLSLGSRRPRVERDYREGMKGICCSFVWLFWSK